MRGYQGIREKTQKSIMTMLEKWAETLPNVDQSILDSFYFPTNKNEYDRTLQCFLLGNL